MAHFQLFFIWTYRCCCCGISHRLHWSPSTTYYTIWPWNRIKSFRSGGIWRNIRGSRSLQQLRTSEFWLASLQPEWVWLILPVTLFSFSLRSGDAVSQSQRRPGLNFFPSPSPPPRPPDHFQCCSWPLQIDYSMSNDHRTGRTERVAFCGQVVFPLSSCIDHRSRWDTVTLRISIPVMNMHNWGGTELNEQLFFLLYTC